MFLEEFTTYIKYFLMTYILRIEVLHGQYFHVFYLRLLKKDPTSVSNQNLWCRPALPQTLRSTLGAKDLRLSS